MLAQNMEGIAQSWLVLELTNSPLLLGLTGLAFAIPTITLTLLGGVIADCADRRRIMIFSQLGSASILFHSRHCRDRWMDRIVAGYELGLSIGVHQSFRPAESYGLASTDGA